MIEYSFDENFYLQIPFSGRNPHFDSTLRIRPHILVLNKHDLSTLEGEEQKLVEAKLKQDHNVDHVIYANCKKNVKSLINKTVSGMLFLMFLYKHIDYSIRLLTTSSSMLFLTK